MNRRTILWLVPIAMAGAALWLLGGERMAPAAPRSADAAPAEAPEAAPPEASVATATASTTAPAVEARGDGAPDAASDRRVALPPGSAVIRGRCVDELAAPLAGVQVTLRGWASNSTRMARHRLDHGEVVWHNPDAIVTPDDGSFEFRFDPPPPYQFALATRANGRASLGVRWGELARDAAVDLGDVVVARGVAVRGRVVDDDGAGVADLRLGLRCADREGGVAFGEVRVRDSASASTDAGGWFDVGDPIAPGRWQVVVEGREVRTPDRPVDFALPSADLRIVVAPLATTGTTISGIVVDPSGAPLRSVLVRSDTGLNETSTGRDGTFQLRARPGTEHLPGAMAATRVVFTGQGLTEHTTAEPIAWGSSDLRVVLEPGPPLTLRVRRADDGTPVERFGITLTPIRSNGQTWSSDSDVKHVGEHPGGVLEIARATTGRFRLVVRPAESTGLPASGAQVIEVTVGVPQTVDIALAARATRQVVIVNGADEPLAGARIELLEHQDGGLVSLGMRAMAEELARYNSPGHVAILLSAATTDAAGRASVSARGGQDFALRLPGPGHVPIVVQPFRVDGAEPARIVVSGGATLRGRITPPELVAALRVDAGLPATGDVAADLAQYVPGIRLEGTGQRNGEAIPSGNQGHRSAPIADDGSYVVAGIPPGTWRVVLASWTATTGVGLGGGGRSSSQRLVHGKLTLADGEQRELDFELAQWVPQTVELRVRVDGTPFEGPVSLRGQLAAAPDGSAQTEQRIVGTDSDGRGTARLLPGRWSAVATVPIDKGWAMIEGPTSDVHAQTHSLEIDLRRASRSVVVLDPEGAPAANLTLWSYAIGGAAPAQSTTSDAEGRAMLHGAPGSVTLRTLRRAFLDEATYRQWQLEVRRDATRRDAALVDLGTVELFAGESPEQVVRLPREWTELPK